MTSLVVCKVINGRVVKLKLVRVLPELIGEGVVKLERTQVICPACGQQVEAVASDGRVKGYCAVAKQHVDFLITQGIAVPMVSQASAADTRAKISAALTGKQLSAETRAKIATAHKGKHHTAETRAKLSASLRRWHNRKGEDVIGQVASRLPIMGMDSRGRFAKGNVPWNKRLDSTQSGIMLTRNYCGEPKPIEEMEVARRFFPPLPICRDCWKLLE